MAIEVVYSVLLPEESQVVFYDQRDFQGDTFRLENNKRKTDGENKCICFDMTGMDGYRPDVLSLKYLG